MYQAAASHAGKVDAQPDFQVRRGSDFQDATLETTGRKSKFAIVCVPLIFVFIIQQAYGFKSIQNIVRKLKRGKNIYDYVEIMACPQGKYLDYELTMTSNQGCNNGGGQILPGRTYTNSQEEILADTQTAYDTIRWTDVLVVITSNCQKGLSMHSQTKMSMYCLQICALRPTCRGPFFIRTIIMWNRLLYPI